MTDPQRHPAFGLCAPERGWVPAPTYLLRRRRVLSLIEDSPKGRLLEIGCGAGALLDDLSRLGYDCEAIETSADAYRLATSLNAGNPKVSVSREPSASWEGAFDTLLALEVLEHQEEDALTLRSWLRWLKPGGRIVASVPARAAMWSASDEWAGHFRRYERAKFKALLEEAGCEVEHLECYGFPLSNLVEPFRARHHRKLLAQQSGAQTRPEGTARSGTERTLETRLYPFQAGWAGSLAIRAFCRVQTLFSGADLGTGYLAIARKR